jgi:hypothetical protein
MGGNGKKDKTKRKTFFGQSSGAATPITGEVQPTQAGTTPPEPQQG